jgi:SSU processome protein Utp24
MDTNALMMPVECDIRVFDELDRLFGRDLADTVVPSAVLDELDDLAGGHGEAATAASVGKILPSAVVSSKRTSHMPTTQLWS